MDNSQNAAPVTEINTDNVSAALTPRLLQDKINPSITVSVVLKDDGKLTDISVIATLDGDLFPTINVGTGFCNIQIDAEGFGKNATEAMENLKNVLPPQLRFNFVVDTVKGKSVENIDADVQKRVDQYKNW